MHVFVRRSLARGAAAVAALAITAGVAAAQAAVNPFSLGISGGAVVPTGEFGEDFETGYAVNGIIGLRLPAVPIAFRGEVGYARNNAKISDDVRLRTISGVANAVFNLAAGPTTMIRPYLIGGVGAYNLKFDVEGVDEDELEEVLGENTSETKLGLNGGIGVELPLSGISVFGEVRFTSVFTEGSNLNFVPITVGIRF